MVGVLLLHEYGGGGGGGGGVRRTYIAGLMVRGHAVADFVTTCHRDRRFLRL